MKLTQFVEEDFANYKKVAMFLGTSKCDGKCWREQGLTENICQNHSLYNQLPIIVPDDIIVNRYNANPITQAIVIGGLEPLMDKSEIIDFIKLVRESSDDDIVIYTGYTEEECSEFISKVKQYPNIVMKFGRYLPNQDSIYDEILGVTLASNNQYAKIIS